MFHVLSATYPAQYMLLDFIVPTDQCLVKTGPTYYDAILKRIFFPSQVTPSKLGLQLAYVPNFIAIR